MSRFNCRRGEEDSCQSTRRPRSESSRGDTRGATGAGVAQRHEGVRCGPRARRQFDRRSTPARCTRCSARTGQASPPWSRSSAGVHQPDSGELMSTAGPSCSHGPARSRARTASLSSTRNSTSSPISASPRTSSWGASRSGRWHRDRPRRDAAARRARAVRAARRHASTRHVRRAACRVADQQIVEIAKAISVRRQGHHHGRADGGADIRRGRPALRRRPRACAHEGAAVLFITHRLEEVVRDRPAGHGHARRPLRSHGADRGPDRSTTSIRSMVGRDLGSSSPSRRRPPARSSSRSSD